MQREYELGDPRQFSLNVTLSSLSPMALSLYVLPGYESNSSITSVIDTK